MHVLIETDGGTAAKEVADLDEAQALADAGNTVLVPNKDGGHRVLAASGEVPEASPAPAVVAKKTPEAKKAPAKKAAVTRKKK